MSHQNPRSRRLAQQIQRELATLLQFEVNDPEVSSVTITDVELTGDLAYAKVFYSAVDHTPESGKALQKMSGFLRRKLAQRLMTRTVPRLSFVHDNSIVHGIHMSRLIDGLTFQDENSGLS